MDIQPADQILEIGFGHGVSIALICDKLRTGKVIGIDRSAKMVQVAGQRNAAHVSAGKAELQVMALENADFGEKRFNKVLAVNITEPGSPLVCFKASRA